MEKCVCVFSQVAEADRRLSLRHAPAGLHHRQEPEVPKQRTKDSAGDRSEQRGGDTGGTHLAGASSSAAAAAFVAGVDFCAKAAIKRERERERRTRTTTTSRQRVCALRCVLYLALFVIVFLFSFPPLSSCSSFRLLACLLCHGQLLLR